MRVCMFVYNPLTNDSRVFREAASLVARGDTVELIAAHRRGLPLVEERDGFTIRRVPHVSLRLRWRRRRSALRAVFFTALRMAGNLRRWRFPLSQRDEPPRFDPELSPPSQPQASSAGAAPGGARRKSLLRRQLTVRDYWKRTLRLLEELPPFDVFHAHDLNTLPVAEKAARRAGGRLVYDSHEIFIERQIIGSAERRIWRRIEARLIGRADRVITVCEPIADELARRYGVETPMVLMNCPERANDPPSRSSELLRQKAGLDGTEEPIVLYQGMVQPERGLETLIDAAGRIDRGAVVIMGKGLSQAKLQDQIEAAGLTSRVRMTGPVPPEELPAYTAAASIGVAPFDGSSLNSYWVSPNKLFEYLAAGLPVVVTRMPVMERIVDEHEVGLICEPDDAEGLAAAIDRLLSDPELYERCRRNAIEASKLFNWDRESAKLVQLYEELGADRPLSAVAEGA
ncbi:MAG: hypothetical protein QOJ38_1107 [Solirubrobacterales bacterium]|jgi:glycosyltransferase involved in cell wall biosynthesis|nr:hypothetical protein [Solirubrobacterales bacterium]